MTSLPKQARIAPGTGIESVWGVLRMQVREAPLPAVADAYMGYMRLRITEELAWMRGSPLYAMLTSAGDAAEDDNLQRSILKAST